MSETTRRTRCLLCSLLCPVALAARHGEGAEEVLTEYVADDPLTQGRLCFRGHYLAEMATHPFRLTRPELRLKSDGRRGDPTKDGAISALAARLRQAGKNAAVVVDGNQPTEGIRAALRLAHDVVGTDLAAVYLPDSDAGLLRGIRPGTPMVTLAEVSRCDAFLAVGDAFSTHPIISRHVLDARATGRAKVFALDCTPNRLTGFAAPFLRVTPGGEATALAALCIMVGGAAPGAAPWAKGRSAAELAQAAGLSESALRPVADALSAAKKAAVLLDPVPGRSMNADASALAASALCEACGARLMPLFRYGNAVGAARAAAAEGAVDMTDVIRRALNRRLEALLVIGVDLMRVLAPAHARDLRGRVATLAAASAFRTRTADEADIVLPLALWFEQTGAAWDATGARIELKQAMPAPGAAVSIPDLCARLAAASGASWTDGAPVPEAEPFLGRAAEDLERAETTGQGLQLVARPDIPDFDPGSESRMLSWPRYVASVPELLLNPADAAERNLASRAKVLVRASNSEVRAQVRPSSDIPKGMAALSAAFPDTRTLFRRVSDDGLGLDLAPCEAEITPEADL